jgi:hypothetical protein
VGFAAGTLFGGTSLHLLHEYVDEYGFDTTAGALLVSGICLAFVLERLSLGTSTALTNRNRPCCRT